jgi:hypothetical protein
LPSIRIHIGTSKQLLLLKAEFRTLTIGEFRTLAYIRSLVVVKVHLRVGADLIQDSELTRSALQQNRVCLVVARDSKQQCCAIQRHRGSDDDHLGVILELLVGGREGGNSAASRAVFLV